MKFIPNLILLTTISVSAHLPAKAFQSREMNAAEIRLGLRKLSVLGSVLYIAAHPDDENTNLLTYFGKERLLRTGYLALTRGEGGQNLIGPEKGDMLGLIRTQELLAARGIDGAEQYFSRAIDFGYSKSSAEAIGFWGEEEILSDIVRVIRTMQPDVIITRFSPEIGGHGHHTASAILARKAFEMSGDPDAFPEQLTVLRPWRATRLLFNGSSFMLRQFDTTGAIKLDIGGYNPLLGRSYNEISGASRSMHKSQGFGAAESRGEVINYFRHTAGDSARADLFEGIDMTWSRIPGADAAAFLIRSALENFDADNPAGILPFLLRAHRELAGLGENPWIATKKRELVDLIQSAAGLWIEARSGDFSATAGDTVAVTASVINRSGVEFTLRRLSVPFAGADSAVNVPLADNDRKEFLLPVMVPADETPTIPYWLRNPSTGFRYNVTDPADIGLPERPSPYSVRFTIESGGSVFDVTAPIRYAWVDPVEGQRYRPFIVTPRVLLNPEEKVIVVPPGGEKSLTVRLTAGRAGVSGSVRLDLPDGWTASPGTIPFTIAAKNGRERVTFTVRSAPGARAGTFAVTADAGGAASGLAEEATRYPHIPAQVLFRPATGNLITAGIPGKKSFIGYIDGSGDEIPEALRQMGYEVRLLTDEDIAAADLGQFQSIIAGVRAYNTRPALAAVHARLMEYVRRGGTYVVQYVTRANMETDEIGPFPLKISRERVSDENARVTLLAPGHPALTFPNAIGTDDFSGWVQERGLYFAGEWDSSYTAVLSAGDPGEPQRSGGLLVARYGDGYYCYTGLSFFRQLPAGVPGAYRLFANLVELGTREEPEKVRGGK